MSSNPWEGTLSMHWETWGTHHKRELLLKNEGA